MITSKPSRRSATRALPAVRGEYCSRAAAVFSQSVGKRDSARPLSPLRQRHSAGAEFDATSVRVGQDLFATMAVKISALEVAVLQLVKALTKPPRSASRQNHYTTEQFASATTGRLNSDMVQQNCREGRLFATKANFEREWRLSRADLKRYEAEGPVPINKSLYRRSLRRDREDQE
jgi:hypothetical protein